MKHKKKFRVRDSAIWFSGLNLLFAILWVATDIELFHMLWMFFIILWLLVFIYGYFERANDDLKEKKILLDAAERLGKAQIHFLEEIEYSDKDYFNKDDIYSIFEKCMKENGISTMKVEDDEL